MNVVAGADSASGSGEIRIGISSWGDLPGFYPSGIKAADKLTWYSRFFTVVEVNVSFYRIVPHRTYLHWMDSTPDALLFDVKALGELTHFRERPEESTFAGFRDSFAPLNQRGRIGGVLFQFPPRFTNTEASRAYLRRVAREMDGDLTIVEFRHVSWLTAESAKSTLALLEELGLAYAIADEPQLPGDTPPPLPAVTNPELAYVRLHGRNAAGWYRGSGIRYDYDYSDSELASWAATIVDLTHLVRQVHVLFNNNARGAGTRNAIDLGRLLGVAPTETPELPATQPPLFGDTG